MPEALYAIGLIAGYTSLYPLTRRGTALSSLADAVRGNASVVTEFGERSLALFGAKAEALSCLRALAIECSEPDWDGYGAEPINAIAVKRAEIFLRSLSGEMPIPEFSVEPDGDISLDWLPTRTKSFSMSIGESDRIAYAWIDGTDRGHAVARSSAGEVPDRILQELSRIVAYVPTIRIA